MQLIDSAGGNLKHVVVKLQSVKWLPDNKKNSNNSNYLLLRRISKANTSYLSATS